MATQGIFEAAARSGLQFWRTYRQEGRTLATQGIFEEAARSGLRFWRRHNEAEGAAQRAGWQFGRLRLAGRRRVENVIAERSLALHVRRAPRRAAARGWRIDIVVAE